ncbi:unnamed protein product [Allacma fusca]|uniref:Uncharacterized protein n=1 Tax=Allacma fusca TaxID=39272 RepID=A0A8J2JSG9_9HEXA|nr:unnamed protein product [Allacma fusca]
MISNFSHTIIHRYFQWTNAIHIFPYIYNKDECEIQLGPNSRKWFLISWIFIFHTVFITWRIFQDFFFHEGRIQDFLFRFFFVAAAGLASTNQLNSLVNYKELVSLITMFLRLDRIYTSKYRVGNTVDVLGIYIGGLFPVIVLSQVILYIGIYFYDPRSPNFLNSFLSTEPYSVISILMLVPEIVFFISAWSSVYWSLLLSFTFQMSLNYWLQRLSLKNCESDRGKFELKNFQALRTTYRELQIITTMFNNTMAHVYQPLHTFFMGGICVTCAFTTVHCYGTMHWFAYMLSPVTTIAVLIYYSISTPNAAGILSHSEDFICSWRMAESNAGMTKFFHSCPGLRIKMGSQYYIQKSTLFIFFNILANQTIALLVGVR